MLVDPCAGDLKPSAYSGRAGYLARFSTTASFTVPASNAALIAYHPGAGNVSYTAAASGTTSITPTWGPTSSGLSAPLGFMYSTARGARAVAACITFTYIGSELNRSGMVGTLVAPCDEALFGGAATTVSAKLNSCQAVARTPAESFDVRFVPCPLDEQYVNLQGAPSEYFGDRCALVIPVVAGTNALDFRVRLTVIYEYLPLPDAAMPVTNATTPVPVGGLERLVNAAHRVPNMISTLDRVAGSVYKAMTSVANSGTFKLAASMAPMLLTG